MDLFSLQVNEVAIRNSIFSSRKSSILEKSLSTRLVSMEIKFTKKRNLSVSGFRTSFVVKAKENNEDDSSSSSGGEDSQGNKSDNGNKSGDSANPKSFGLNTNWREFRANLFMKEQEEKAEVEGHEPATASHESELIRLKWAHPIPFPETGCVLVATEKLDGYRTFARTVVLLLRTGTNHPQEGPFGVIINRPLHKNVKHMKSTKTELATTFSECSLYFGGPLEASMFLLKTGYKTKIPGFEEIMPGLNFGFRNSLNEAAILVKKGILKPHDFKFFAGYAGWQLDQLKEEIELEYWHVAACSSDLIYGASSGNLWEEILQLMGGEYLELSRKPKLDM